MQPNKPIFYELKGRSLEATLLLHKKVEEDLGALLDGIDDRDEMRSIYHAFKAQNKDLYDACGQNQPAIQVQQIDTLPPRAYARTPEVYFHPVHYDRVLLLSHVDHKGNHFVPQDAVRLTDEETATMCIGLYAGGHSSPQPVVVPIAPRGVQTPIDFDPATSIYERKSAAFFELAKVAKLLEVFERHKAYLVADKAIPGITNPDDVTFECLVSRGEDNRPHLLVKAFNTQTKEPLSIKDNIYFTPRSVGEFQEVVTRSHKPIQMTDTAGGGALQSFIDAIPDLSLADAWDNSDTLDIFSSIKPPPPPLSLLHLNSQAPWPFPKSTP